MSVYGELVTRRRTFCHTGQTKEIQFRTQALNNLQEAIGKHQYFYAQEKDFEAQGIVQTEKEKPSGSAFAVSEGFWVLRVYRSLGPDCPLWPFRGVPGIRFFCLVLIGEEGQGIRSTSVLGGVVSVNFKIDGVTRIDGAEADTIFYPVAVVTGCCRSLEVIMLRQNLYNLQIIIIVRRAVKMNRSAAYPVPRVVGPCKIINIRTVGNSLHGS
ncbi:hypothetical protein PC41400_00915 [Paenibacillus chitinolyticus]|uniref:Uncharacterized protein n=1 Tax=Paenibacillus chitinolyticus TaxID=79263 RepID=A0A410WPS6_9BACL|nr:hypothetical protein PC41400_00915 [Paenibacillus chitinolyticus]